MNHYNTCAECNKEFAGRKKKYCSKECSDEVRRRKNRERWRANNKPKEDVTIKCEWCGRSYDVPARTAHQARFCSNDCRFTFHSREKGIKPIDEWITIREKQKRIRQAKLEKERAIRTLRTTLTKVSKLKEEEERIRELTRECEECGVMFYDPLPHSLTCSKECSRKRSNRVIRYHDRNRINKHNLVDKDISLKRLYKRDTGICYLCGEPCDYNDKVITVEGHYIVGRTYPSIEHVKPLSKGGKHSWDNVKLAHHWCNTQKSDNIINEQIKALV